MTKLEKFKKIMKYTCNILAFINAVLIGLTPIWNIPYGKEISDSISIIIGAIATYLLGQKIITNVKGKE